MALSVKIESFEGPLDLLLHLLDINKFNIFDIPIVEITAQYMEYLTSMKEQDLNVMSEFLVMAATLLEIKARMLLPAEVDEDGEEIDPIRSKFGRIEQEEVSLDEKMVRVREYAAANQQFRFSALLEGQKGRIQLIVTFLAILELMKTGELSVVQEHPFDDILITAQL